MLELTRKRTARGWSKSELARRSRMTSSEVGKIESGRLLPYPSQLRKLAKALGVAVKDVSSLMQEVTQLTPEGNSHA